MLIIAHSPKTAQQKKSFCAALHMHNNMCSHLILLFLLITTINFNTNWGEAPGEPPKISAT